MGFHLDPIIQFIQHVTCIGATFSTHRTIVAHVEGHFFALFLSYLILHAIAETIHIEERISATSSAVILDPPIHLARRVLIRGLRGFLGEAFYNPPHDLLRPIFNLRLDPIWRGGTPIELLNLIHIVVIAEDTSELVLTFCLLDDHLHDRGRKG